MVEIYNTLLNWSAVNENLEKERKNYECEDSFAASLF